MHTHVHICYHCERSEEVEGPRCRTTLPEGWQWQTRRREKEPNAVAVCPKCWKEKGPEIAMSRIRGSQTGKPKATGCCG
jgi:hypothetical protein